MHYQWRNPQLAYSEVRKLIVDQVQDFLTEIDNHRDNPPKRKDVPQAYMMLFPKTFAGEVILHEQVGRKGHSINCMISFDGSEHADVRDKLFSRLEELGFEVVKRE